MAATAAALLPAHFLSLSPYSTLRFLSLFPKQNPKLLRIYGALARPSSRRRFFSTVFSGSLSNREGKKTDLETNVSDFRKKDADLESALSRNRRWIVNNQLKNIILRCPQQVAPVKHLQKKFKTLDLQGKALNWVKKYPCCFQVYLVNDDYYCRLTKRMMALVEEEEALKDTQEPVFADRLAKFLMMTVNRRLNVVKLNEIKRSLGFPDDYIIRLLPKYPETFRLVNHSGRKNSMEIELLSWKPELAVSSIETQAREKGIEPGFTFCLPATCDSKAWEMRFKEFNASPYISPYVESVDLEEGSMEMEKRRVSLVHELLSMTLWKKLSVVKLSHFKREFGLPEKLGGLFSRHPGIFYVSNKYRIYTVVLREGYSGSELVRKDPIVEIKDKFGELMQEGLHEYNRRRHLENLEKKRRKGMEFVRPSVKRMNRDEEEEEEDNIERGNDKLGVLGDPEERKRFYKVLFDDAQ